MSLPSTKTISLKVFPSLAAALVLTAFGLNTPSSSAQSSFSSPLYPNVTPKSPDTLTQNQTSVLNYFNSIPSSSNPAYIPFFGTLNSLDPLNQATAFQAFSPEYNAQQLIFKRTVTNTNMGNMREALARYGRPANMSTGGRTMRVPGAGRFLADGSSGGNPDFQRVSYVDGGIPMNGSTGYGNPHYSDPAYCAKPSQEDETITTWGFNGSGSGSGGKFLLDGNSIGIKNTMATGLVGLSYNLSENFVVGLWGVYNRAHFGTGLVADVVAFGASADVDSYAGGLYFVFSPLPIVSLTGTAGYNHNQINNRLGINITPPGVANFNILSRGRQSGNDFLSSLNLDIYLPLGLGNSFLHTTVGANYSYMSQNGFTQEFGGIFNIDFDPSNNYSLQSVVGLELGYVIEMGSMMVVPHANTSYSHEYAPIGSTGVGDFVNVVNGGILTGSGSTLGRDYFGCGGGIAVIVNSHLSLFGDYGYSYATHTATHSGSGGFSLNW